MSETDPHQALRARNTLTRTMRTLLKGTGLDIRELASELVISLPGHPEHGRIYITYSNGDVSHRQTTWHYLGHLDGHGPTDPDAEPAVTTGKIIKVLSGQTDGTGWPSTVQPFRPEDGHRWASMGDGSALFDRDNRDY